MRYSALILAGLLLVGCSHAPTVPPVTDDSPVPAPPPPPVAVVTPGAPRPSAGRPAEGRDPFSKPLVAVLPATKDTVVVVHHPDSPHHPTHHPTPVQPVAVAPDHIDYTVAGIFHSGTGDVALLQGKSGPVLVSPGTHLDGEARVQSIDRQKAEVDVSWGSKRFILPLHGSVSTSHSNAGTMAVQDPSKPGTNRG